MKAREHNASHLDVQDFAKEGATLEGEWPLRELPRLAASAQPDVAPAPVAWQARGELQPMRGGAAQVWLHVAANTAIGLECQRCLQTVPLALEAQRSFLFVHGETAAAELDADSEDDVLALTRALDLRELVEDELLLSLPLVPRHEVCPQPLPAQRQADDVPAETPNPFAALAVLKSSGGH